MRRLAQLVDHFRDEAVSDRVNPPAEHVAVFVNDVPWNPASGDALPFVSRDIHSLIESACS